MSRLSIVPVLVLAVALLAATFAATPASAGSSARPSEQYRKYALLRERLKACSLDRTWRHLGSTARRRCRSLRRNYLLYAINGESGTFYVYCRKRARRCPPAPTGVRNPRTPPPAGATIFR